MINIYLIIINILAFIVYGIDKFCAIYHLRRISEKGLLSISFLGGSIGSLLAMITFRHKTKKIKFYVLNTIFLIIHITLYYYLKQKGVI